MSNDRGQVAILLLEFTVPGLWGSPMKGGEEAGCDVGVGGERDVRPQFFFAREMQITCVSLRMKTHLLA